MEATNQPILSTSFGLTATRITLLGATLAAFTYGLAACLYALIIYLRITEFRRTANKSFRYSNQNMVLTAYTSIMFALVTVGIYENNHLLWRLFPSAPGRSFDDRLITEAGVGVTGAYTSAINSWMADALLTWRAYVLLQADGAKLRILTVGTLCCVLAAEIGLSVNLLVHIEAFGIGGVLNSMAQISALVTNVLAGGIIVIRLLVHRSRIISALGENHGATYISTAAIILESTLIFIIVETFRAAVFLTRSPLFVLGTEVWGPLHAVCSFLVIYRVLQGRAFSRESHAAVSRQMEFACCTTSLPASTTSG